MKLYIASCNEYPLHELVITDWLAKEKELDTILTGDISIRYETTDAYCITIYYMSYSDQRKYDLWLPKSQCKIVERTGPK